MENNFFTDKNICRLCGDESTEGTSIFHATIFQATIITLINKYLPIEVSNNDNLPKVICQACTLQLYSTITFLEVVISGQGKLKNIFLNQKSEISNNLSTLDNVLQPVLPDSNSIIPSHIPTISNASLSSPKHEPTHHGHNTNLSDPLISSSVTSQMDARREQYKAMSDLLSPADVMVHPDEDLSNAHSSTVFSDLSDDIKKIFSLPLDETPLYSKNHVLCTKTIALNEVVPKDPPKKKRGRPRKDASKATADSSQKIQEPVSIRDEPMSKRKRKVPQRYLESVQGTELEKILDATEEDAAKVKFLGSSSIPSADGLLLDDLEPFNIAASDHILDSTNTEPGANLADKTDLPCADGKGTTVPTVSTMTSSSTAKAKVKTVTKLGVTRMRRKKKRNKNLYLYCAVCNKSFRTHLKLKMHRHTHNLLYKCFQCSKYFHIYSNLESHQQTEMHTNHEIVDQNVQDVLSAEDSHVVDSYINEENNQLTCRHCNKQFLTKNCLIIHIKLNLNKSRAYTCPICSQSFQVYTDLRQHIANEHKARLGRQPVSCDICHKEFTHPSSVLYHKQSIHNNEIFKCTKCDKVFQHIQLLNRHQLVHMDTRPYQCPQCPMAYKTNISLSAHLMKHTGAKPYVCEICNKVLTHRSSLISHYRWHQGIKQYQCSQCPKAFNQKGNLKEHFRIHTGEKPFTCNICSRKFTTYSQHKLHLKRHTGEKPHTCELCSKGFLSAESYKCHLRRHKGEKPVTCTFENCTETFVESWAMRKHVRTCHNKPTVNRFPCDKCEKVYSCASYLTKHMKTHEQDPSTTLLNTIDLSILDMMKTNNEATVSTEVLPRADAVAAFSQTDGNVFYLYEDTTGILPADDKTESGMAELTQPSEEPLMEDQSFELVTDGSKIHFVRLPIDLTTGNEPDTSEPTESIIAITNEQPTGVSMPLIELTTDIKLNSPEGQPVDVQEDENFIEFITEDGDHVRMMGVSYDSLQLLAMDSDIQMFTTKNEND
ncbi:hypothetical protein M8J77_018922 [Diaphorina citri]|nr:hypothetical protein M8J77_018922 [Diaphorina citri]